MVRIYLAKYMRDLRRREPVNIGVIVDDGKAIYQRFMGDEAEERPIVVAAVANLAVYDSWMDYWHRTILAGHLDEVLVNRRDLDNYYVEHAGQVLLGEVPDLVEFGRRMFKELVL
jgi:hypothetical protein